MLREIQDYFAIGGFGEHVAFLGGGFGKEFGHAVELGADAVEAFGYADGVVEDCLGGVVGVGFFGGFELVAGVMLMWGWEGGCVGGHEQEEDIVDDALLVGGGLGGGIFAC